jgi:hypothetical protein
MQDVVSTLASYLVGGDGVGGGDALDVLCEVAASDFRIESERVRAAVHPGSGGEEPKLSAKEEVAAAEVARVGGEAEPEVAWVGGEAEPVPVARMKRMEPFRKGRK